MKQVVIVVMKQVIVVMKQVPVMKQVIVVMKQVPVMKQVAVMKQGSGPSSCSQYDGFGDKDVHLDVLQQVLVHTLPC
jgi:hypothetical protein